jgi:uncharacterized protein (DUF983 family)
LLFVTSQDFGPCADSTDVVGVPAAGSGVVAGNGSGSTDVASQQTITAIGGAQQNPCGSTAASLLFVNSNDWGRCAEGSSISEGSVSGVPAGTGSSDLASQQTITAIGGAQQNPCGSTAASLLFVTSQDFGTCADGSSISEGSVSGVPAGTGSSDLASQQTVTLVGGMQQNPCGSSAASLLFTTQQDFGTCGDDVAGAGSGSSVDTSDIASQQTVTLVGGMQQNACGSSAASLLFVTSQDFGACGSGQPRQPGQPGQPGGDEPGSGLPGVSVSGVRVNGQPADEAPGPEVAPGEPVDVTVTVTNTGNTAIDQLGGSGGLSCRSAKLAAGQSTTCGVEYTPQSAGDYTAQVSVTAVGPDGSSSTATGVAYFVVTSNQPGQPGEPGEPGLPSVAVSDVVVNGQPADEAPGPEVASGRPVNVTVTVTNTGGTDIDQLGGSGGLTCRSAKLAAGQSTTCGVQYTPRATGDYTAQVSVTAVGPDGSSSTATGVAYFVVTEPNGSQPGGNQPGGNQPGSKLPGVSMSNVRVNGQPADETPGPQVDPGDPVNVTLTVTNTGGTDIDQLGGSGGLTCRSAKLAAGQSTTCGVEYTPQSAGDYTAQVSVTAVGPDGSSSTASVSVSFVVTEPNGSQPGGNQPGGNQPGGNQPGSKLPGVSMSNVRVNGHPAGETPGPQVDPGDPVNVTVTVTNTGGTDIDQLDGSGGLTCRSAKLAAGQSTTCGVEYTPQSAGDYTAQVSVTAVGPDGSSSTASVSVSFVVTEPNGSQPGGNQPGGNQPGGNQPGGNQPGGSQPGGNQPGGNQPGGNQPGSKLPGVSISDPQVNGEPADQTPGPQVTRGDQVNLTVTVTNTGGTDIDQLGGDNGLDCQDSELAAGQSTTCGVQYTPRATGDYTAQVSVTAVGPDGSSSTATESVSFVVTEPNGSQPAGNQPGGNQPGGNQPGGNQPGSKLPGVSVSHLRVNGQPANETTGPDVPQGDQVKVTMTVTNTGGTEIDQLAGDNGLTCQDGELATGESTTCDVAYKPRATGDYTTEVSVTAVAPNGSSTTATETVAFAVTEPNGSEPGGSQPGGNQPGGNQPGGNQPGGNQPGGNQPGGDQPGGNQPGSGLPGVSVSDAQVNGQPADEAPGPRVTRGDQVDVTVTVTNTGGTNIDQLGGDNGLACQDSELAAGKSTTCGVEYTPRATGDYTTQVSVTASSPDGSTSTATEVVYFAVTDANGSQPGGNQPGGNQPGGSQPGGSQPGGNQPGGNSSGKGELELENPVINGTPAGSQPGPTVDPGATVQVNVSATNTGSGEVTNITGQIPGGSLACSRTELAPGDSTLCTGEVTAPQQAGGYVFGVGVSGTDANSGDPVGGSISAYFTAGGVPGSGGNGVGGSSGSGSQSGQGNGGDTSSDGNGTGSGGAPYNSGNGRAGSAGQYGQVGTVPLGAAHAGYGPTTSSNGELWAVAGAFVALMGAFGLVLVRRRYVAATAGDGGAR